MRVPTRFMARSCYCAVLRTASRKLTAFYDAALAPIGITLAQLRLLRVIERIGAVSLTELADQTELDRSTIGRNVRVLQRGRLVQQVPSTDRREAAIDLTDVGRDVLCRSAPLWSDAQCAVEAKLGTETAVHLRTLLETL